MKIGTKMSETGKQLELGPAHGQDSLRSSARRRTSVSSNLAGTPSEFPMLSEYSLPYLQSTIGNYGLQRLLIQRQSAEIPGRDEVTEFGRFWVVPDDTDVCYDVDAEQISERDFQALDSCWKKIKDGQGNLQVAEVDSTGTGHSGFRKKVVERLAKLLAAPMGRGLVTDLVAGSKMVTIRPSNARQYGGATATGGADALEVSDGNAGSGATTVIDLDSNLGDNDILVYDSTGKQIADPVFIILIHELIHAQHNAHGQNRVRQASTDAAYSNREEEETIGGGQLNKNDLRSEHSLNARFGHSGVDTRFP